MDNIVMVFMRSAVAWDYLMLLNRLWTRVLASWICFTLWTKEEMEPPLLYWDILLYFNDNLFILREKEKRKREIIEKTEDGKKERESENCDEKR